ncbi:hypothetical protein SAICODRAFT_161418 [Saitoella complicata NRRL Y-17804]|uniref:Uncharacterized protein n=1 Tax=Saitoella complicata (strain BCRC 22490 / CBS 7301 / JCM 7358 / NBRC 10748 / NRRL Y-17804) TaxID=698492 RepID=A0A0E9NIC5_SAICN|nr:uncharacterized protein SAICODRAFT_161418 [Saitoella complicata NRRL Y-17804]ODQ51006.1 hypothetical protein SAICODRAFT_161418 [Saitoella complicata NRRL Y-17804]GAO49622.1 hypothetical protein G7K_3771-t1 [Saitoella complicata NRRL Y-17804]
MERSWQESLLNRAADCALAPWRNIRNRWWKAGILGIPSENAATSDVLADRYRRGRGDVICVKGEAFLATHPLPDQAVGVPRRAQQGSCCSTYPLQLIPVTVTLTVLRLYRDRSRRTVLRAMQGLHDLAAPFAVHVTRHLHDQSTTRRSTYIKQNSKTAMTLNMKSSSIGVGGRQSLGKLPMNLRARNGPRVEGIRALKEDSAVRRCRKRKKSLSALSSDPGLDFTRVFARSRPDWARLIVQS